MATVTRDANNSSSENADEGFIYRERVVISGVVGADVPTAIWNALLDAAMPKRGDSRVIGINPDDITIIAQRHDLRSFGMEKGGTVRLEFEIPWRQRSPVTIVVNSNPNDDGPGVATVGAVVETLETEFDRTGTEITVQREAGAPTLIQPVQYRRPSPVIEFSRWENTNPRTRAETYVGKINSALWNGYAAETVLCTAIVGTTRDDGDTYDVRYEFEQRSTWDTTVVYIDEQTGRPPSGLVEGVSKKTNIKLYNTANFSLLNITL